MGTNLDSIVHRVLGINGELVEPAILDPLGSLFGDCAVRKQSEELVSARYTTEGHGQQFAAHNRPCANAAHNGDKDPRLVDIARTLSKQIVAAHTVKDGLKLLALGAVLGSEMRRDGVMGSVVNGLRRPSVCISLSSPFLCCAAAAAAAAKKEHLHSPRARQGP